MEEVEKRTKNNVKNSSKVRKENNLSSDELLEQIMNKKNTRKTSTKKNLNKDEVKEEILTEKKSSSKKTTSRASSTNKSSAKTTKKTTKKVSTKKANKTELSADELLSSIVEKKKAKSTKKNSKSSSSKETKKTENNQSVDLIANDQTSSTSSINDATDNKEVVKDEKVIENEKQDKEVKKKVNDDLIITRKIVFDDEKLNLKNKKTLAELRKAIEEFDRMETLSEIASSSDKINDIKTDIVEQPKERKDFFNTSMLAFGKRSKKYQEDSEENSTVDIEEKNEHEETSEVYEYDNEIVDEEQDHIDESDYLRSCGSFVPQDVRPKKAKKRKFVDKNTIIAITFVLLLLLFVFILISYFRDAKLNHTVKVEPTVIDIVNPKNDVLAPSEIEDELAREYNDCLNAPYSERVDWTDELWEAYQSLEKLMDDNYRGTVVYENLATGYSFTINSSYIFEKYTNNGVGVYYAASTIKVLDALYIYTGAAKGEINLDDTMTYKSKHKYKDSKGMEQYNFGAEVSLRELVKYAIMYSDNSAHQMLVEYIGHSTLRDFGLSLGARYTLQDDFENFGNISGGDAVIYMTAVNNFINNNPTLGAELKDMLVNADQNDLEIPELGIKAAHKYGCYSSYYHDYGIVYADSPYIVAILTLDRLSDSEDKVREKINILARRVYEYNQLFTENRKNKCQIEVYGK